MKKYEKVFPEDYKKWYRENAALRAKTAADPDRLHYHIQPETGWLNDPNGLCQFQGVYHIYYQYSPFDTEGQLKLWGHVTTRDFIHYDSWDPAVYPDSDLDAHGAYSGSALVQKDMIHYFYTGNIKYFDRPDYDYIMTGRGSNTIHMTSRDGFSFSPKELVLSNSDYPKDMSAHIRDPKVIQENGIFYMALGARDRNSQGMVLVYRSQDLEHWDYHTRITTKNPFGYMWECPDLVRLGEELFLICCPQGVASQGIDYQNVHQCTAMRLKGSLETGQIEPDESWGIHLMDRGFDFYAPQSFEDEGGRRILIGWMGIPDADYTNPTVQAGWQHALTIPRQLVEKEGHLLQRPLKELEHLKGKMILEQKGDLSSLSADAGLVYHAALSLEPKGRFWMELRKDVRLIWEEGILTLDLGSQGSGRTRRQVRLEKLESLEIFSDTTSLEIFVNQGREVFTTRVYGREPGIQISGSCPGSIVIYEMNRIQVK